MKTCCEGNGRGGHKKDCPYREPFVHESHCCCGMCDEMDWDSKPSPPPPEGTPARIMYDYYSLAVMREFTKASKMLERFK